MKKTLLLLCLLLPIVRETDAHFMHDLLEVTVRPGEEKVASHTAANMAVSHLETPHPSFTTSQKQSQKTTATAFQEIISLTNIAQAVHIHAIWWGYQPFDTLRCLSTNQNLKKAIAVSSRQKKYYYSYAVDEKPYSQLEINGYLLKKGKIARNLKSAGYLLQTVIAPQETFSLLSHHGEQLQNEWHAFIHVGTPEANLHFFNHLSQISQELREPVIGGLYLLKDNLPILFEETSPTKGFLTLVTANVPMLHKKIYFYSDVLTASTLAYEAYYNSSAVQHKMKLAYFTPPRSWEDFHDIYHLRTTYLLPVEMFTINFLGEASQYLLADTTTLGIKLSCLDLSLYHIAKTPVELGMSAYFTESTRLSPEASSLLARLAVNSLLLMTHRVSPLLVWLETVFNFAWNHQHVIKGFEDLLSAAFLSKPAKSGRSRGGR